MSILKKSLSVSLYASLTHSSYARQGIVCHQLPIALMPSFLAYQGPDPVGTTVQETRCQEITLLQEIESTVQKLVDSIQKLEESIDFTLLTQQMKQNIVESLKRNLAYLQRIEGMFGFIMRKLTDEEIDWQFLEFEEALPPTPRPSVNVITDYKLTVPTSDEAVYLSTPLEELVNYDQKIEAYRLQEIGYLKKLHAHICTINNTIFQFDKGLSYAEMSPKRKQEIAKSLKQNVIFLSTLGKRFKAVYKLVKAQLTDWEVKQPEPIESSVGWQLLEFNPKSMMDEADT